MEYKFSTENFEKEVLQSDVPVLIDFYADWCGPCKMMAPIVADIANEYEGKLKVGKVNVDEQPALAQQFRVMSIPTFAVIKNGETAGVFIGGMPKNELMSKVEQVLN